MVEVHISTNFRRHVVFLEQTHAVRSCSTLRNKEIFMCSVILINRTVEFVKWPICVQMDGERLTGRIQHIIDCQLAHPYKKPHAFTRVITRVHM